MSEIFSDSARGKFSKSQAELSARLKGIENCINNEENLQEVNIEFCKQAFRLLADCRLITEEKQRGRCIQLSRLSVWKYSALFPRLKLIKITPAKCDRGFFFVKTSSVLAGNFDKAKGIFDLADVQAFDIVVHLLREGSNLAVADDVIFLFVA